MSQNRIETAFGWVYRTVIASVLVLIGIAIGMIAVPTPVKPSDLVSLKAEVLSETKRLVASQTTERRVYQITTPIVVGPEKPEGHHRRRAKKSPETTAKRAAILHALAERKQKLAEQPIELVFGE